MRLDDVLELLSSFQNKPPIRNQIEIDESTIAFFETEKDRILAGGNVKWAESLINGKLCLKNFEPVAFEKIDWGINPFSDRNWLWRFHQLEFLIDLMKAHLEASDNRFLDDAIHWVNSWISDNYRSQTQSVMAWHDHATALRLRHLLLFRQVTGTTSKLDGDFDRVLVDHCRLLADPGFYMEHTNHGFDQMLILLVAAKMLTEYEESREWSELASNRLVNEIKFAFSERGVHVENSPAYHQLMLMSVIHARDTFIALSIDVDCDFDKLLTGGVEFLAWMTQPDGNIPTIGDSTSIPSLLSLSGLVDCPASDYLRYCCSKGHLGSPPNNDFSIFYEDGWAIFRSQFCSPHEFQSSIQLIMKSAFFSNYHRHDDDTSITLHAFGRRWFIDTGMYNYHEKEDKRVFVRSVLGHNLMVLDGARVNRDVNQVGGKTRMWLDSEKDNIAIASSNMFEGYTIQRTLEKISEMEFLITDLYTASDGAPCLNRAWVQFHIPLQIKIAVNDEFINLADCDGNRVILQSLNPISRISIHSGENNGKILSWNSTHYGIGEDSQVIRFHLPQGNKESMIKIKLIRGENNE